MGFMDQMVNTYAVLVDIAFTGVMPFHNPSSNNKMILLFPTAWPTAYVVMSLNSVNLIDETLTKYSFNLHFMYKWI